MRGYAIIGLSNPKRDSNVGGVMRAAHVYGAAGIVIAGLRYKNQRTDTTKAYKHIPVFERDDLMSIVPYGCVPVAIEIHPDARNLINYVHPETAYYIFGPEDGSLGDGIISQCRDVVYVPTKYCMNLASTVNVVLYDRMAKRGIK